MYKEELEKIREMLDNLVNQAINSHNKIIDLLLKIEGDEEYVK